MNVNYCSGFGVKHTDKHKPFSTITWSQITELVDCPQDIDKARGQWIIPSTLVSRLRRDQEKGGEYWMLWADIDDKPPVLDELSKFLSVFLDGSRFEVYTTKSATESIQKTRVLIPLNEPLTPQQWKECQQVLNDELEVNLVPPDRCSEKLQQLVLLPNKGDFYGSRSQRTGSYFSPLEAFSDAITTRKHTASQPKTASKTMLDFNASIPAANEASGYGMKALESECLAITKLWT
jgi:hypothetical protein